MGQGKGGGERSGRVMGLGSSGGPGRVMGLGPSGGPGGAVNGGAARPARGRGEPARYAVAASASARTLTTRSISAFSEMNGGANWIVSPPYRR